jgi:microcystin-dependent protein
MSDPFIGQITMFGGNFAPRGWALCDGQLLSISSNQALFSILGTTYGGDGRTTFALPDLRGRVPIHKGTGSGLPPYSLGQRGGQVNITLTQANLPAHTHAAGSGKMRATPSPADTSDPTGNTLAMAPAYKAENSTVDMAAGTIGGDTASTGGNQQFDNMPPYQAINYIIALVGVFPSRN